MSLARVEQVNLGLSAGAVAASYVFATPLFAVSVAAGALLEAINLGAIHRAAKRVFAGEMLTQGWLGMLWMRFALLGLAIYVTMQMGAHPVALLIGLSIAMPATVIDAWMNRPPVVDPAELPTFLEDFDEVVRVDPDEIGERVWSVGDLMTNRMIVAASPPYESGEDAGGGQLATREAVTLAPDVLRNDLQNDLRTPENTDADARSNADERNR